MTNQTRLDLEQLFEDLTGITEWLAGSCYEAILICLEHHGHESGVQSDLNSLEEKLAALEIVWTRQIDEKTRRAWGDPRNAVEDAAVGIAHLIIPKFTEYTVIERSNIGEGIDYWLGYKEDTDKFMFQRKARLEVSGILLDKQYPSQIKQRVRKRTEQTKQSDRSGLPAYVIVVEFGQPAVYMVKR